MRLKAVRLHNLTPFGELELDFADSEGQPRPLTLLFGAGGVGKTTIVNAIAATRPGHTATLLRRDAGGAATGGFVSCEWLLGVDDPTRPHALTVASPNAKLGNGSDEALRRKEQALFDRMAKRRGFVCVMLPALRHFSRSAVHVSSLTRYDQRFSLGSQEGQRGDLTREIKQALVYAEVVGALNANGSAAALELQRTMRDATNRILGLVGYSYLGVDPIELEPKFRRDEANTSADFEQLPSRARHLVSFVALPLYNAWAAYPNAHPSRTELVVLIDELDAYQEPVAQAGLCAALKEALPQAQWIVTASSPATATSCEQGEVIALRQLPDSDHIRVFRGTAATLH